MVPHDSFGCSACFQGDAAFAWAARADFEVIAVLIDDAHFTLKLLECPQCGQRSVSVFTETVDWTGGDDAQEWLLMPLTSSEAEDLIGQTEEQVCRIVEEVGRRRRCLVVAHPAGAVRSTRWILGEVRIGPHD